MIFGVSADVMESPKVPCILHMDSLKGSHGGLKNIIQRCSSSLYNKFNIGTSTWLILFLSVFFFR